MGPSTKVFRTIFPRGLSERVSSYPVCCKIVWKMRIPMLVKRAGATRYFSGQRVKNLRTSQIEDTFVATPWPVYLSTSWHVACLVYVIPAPRCSPLPQPSPFSNSLPPPPPPRIFPTVIIFVHLHY